MSSPSRAAAETPRRPQAAPEILILGGGLAGSSAAILLARAGRHVTLLEREREPRHKVCGEFLSAEALAILGHLGLDSVALKALGALPIGGVRLCGLGKPVERPLPFPALSLTRHCLDAALLAAAEAAGAHVLRGVRVNGLRREAGLWYASLGTGLPEIAAPAVLLATGKHDLRGLARPPGPQGDLVALKMYWRLQPGEAAALRGHVELLLHPHGYTGLQTTETGTNLCSLVRRKHLASLGGWSGLLGELRDTCPQAAQRLAGAEPLLTKPLAASSIPYGFVRREPLGEDLWAVGDQAAVIPSFTGDGMSIALYTGVSAAEALLRGETPAKFQPALHRRLRPQVARATAISRALVRQPSRSLLLGAVRLWPGLLRHTASLTRLSALAMADIGIRF